MREFAIELARQAGNLLREFLRRGLSETQIRTKVSHADLVTDADIASEQLIAGAIRSSLPEHTIYGEESAVGAAPITDWLWLVDPVDGTTNFAHGLPVFAVNLALAYQGVPVLGVTHDPSTGHTYWAEAGGGAWVRVEDQDRSLRVSGTSVLHRCLFATGLPYERESRAYLRSVAEFVSLDRKAHAVRRLGSAALAQAWVAAGFLDGFWEINLKPWDCAAGWLLVTEAGGRVTDYGGEPWHLNSTSMIASNGQTAIHHDMREAIRTASGSVLYSLGR
jgi:myo-inositol-1(or 4)-monophosphatase